MKYDHVFKNGNVINFDTLETEVKDVFVLDGRIAAAPDGDYEVAFEMDCTGKYVLPGLIDEHTHVNFACSNIGANADVLCPPMGVTAAVDAGTSGWTNFDGFYASNIVRNMTKIFAYLHVSPYGVHSGILHEENHDPADFDEKRIIDKACRYPDTIVGLKVRLSTATLGDKYGIEVLKRTVEIADKVEAARGGKCTVDVHYDNLPDQITLEEICDALRPGDIISHIMQTHRETLFDGENIRKAVLDARKRGVIMDDCHGRVHWSFANLKKAYSLGFYPDIISSDVIRPSTYVRPGFSLLYAMCTALAAGMDEKRILKAVTDTPSKVLGITDRAGTLNPGVPADVCVMDVIEKQMELKDFWGGSCMSEKLFLPLMTMRGGETVFRQIYF